MTVVLFALVSAALYYLASRALITKWLWSRYPRWLAVFLDCSACTGTWFGVLLSIIVGWPLKLTYLGLNLTEPYVWPLVGLCSLVTTPIAAALMQLALDHLGTLAPEEPKPKWKELT